MTLTRYQKFIIGCMAFINFTVILDFMVLSPLGAKLMPQLGIGPEKFGLVVSAYAFSAGASGIVAAGFADRFDRKRFLLFFYIGFLLGTLLCGIADSFPFLLAARIITGIFGGVIGSASFAIITDLFPFAIRGRVMGIVQTAFAASQILGIPVALALTDRWSWHTPFLMIVAITAIVGVVIAFKLQPVRAHLLQRPDKSAIHHLLSTVSTWRYLQAFSTTALMSLGGFMLMPFGTTYAVNNLAIPFAKLTQVYFVTGLCAMFTGPYVGRLADRYGKFNTFCVGSLLSIVLVLIYTRLGPIPLWQLTAIMAIMFMGISSRMIPAQALMSAIPAPQDRGAFMAVSSSVQQFAGGIGAFAAGHIVVERPDHILENFETLGHVIVAASLITMIQMYWIHKSIPEPGLQKPLAT